MLSYLINATGLVSIFANMNSTLRSGGAEEVDNKRSLCVEKPGNC